MFWSPWFLIFGLSVYSEVKHCGANPWSSLLSRSPGFRAFLLPLLSLTLAKINQAAVPSGPSARAFETDMLSHRERRWGKKEANGADAYRYLTGEAEVGGRAAFLAGGGAHAAVGAAGRVLPFPPLCGGLSGRLSFGATSKEKQRQCQEHNAYRRRQGVGVFADREARVFVSVPQPGRADSGSDGVQTKLCNNLEKGMQREHTRGRGAPHICICYRDKSS